MYHLICTVVVSDINLCLRMHEPRLAKCHSNSDLAVSPYPGGKCNYSSNVSHTDLIKSDIFPTAPYSQIQTADTKPFWKMGLFECSQVIKLTKIQKRNLCLGSLHNSGPLLYEKRQYKCSRLIIIYIICILIILTVKWHNLQITFNPPTQTVVLEHFLFIPTQMVWQLLLRQHPYTILTLLALM